MRCMSTEVLSDPGDAVDEQHVAILMADNLVLLLLDGGRDVLHPRGALLGKRGQKHGILNRHRGVEIRVEAVGFDVELAAQLQVGL